MNNNSPLVFPRESGELRLLPPRDDSEMQKAPAERRGIKSLASQRGFDLFGRGFKSGGIGHILEGRAFYIVQSFAPTNSLLDRHRISRMLPLR